jgi:hypothetical protein
MHTIQNKEVRCGRSSAPMLAMALCAMLSTAAHAFYAQQGGPADTTISLTRSACFGDCPNYTVVIDSDGQVRFTTDISPVNDVDAIHRQFAQSKGVLVPGSHKDRVLPQSVSDLLAQFQRVGFWNLQDRYVARVTDNPTQIIELKIGGRRKKVVDYVGTEAGMPQAVRDLEDSIDRVAYKQRGQVHLIDLSK